ncbi:MAG: hypothetical protein EOP61_25975, partial [Sphingomonadales bacterium]
MALLSRSCFPRTRRRPLLRFARPFLRTSRTRRRASGKRLALTRQPLQHPPIGRAEKERPMVNEKNIRGERLAILPCDDFAGLTAGESHVLARYFCGVEEVIGDLGGDPQGILARFGIDPRAFHEPGAHIECARALPLIEECSFLLDDPYFGLDLADRQESGAYGYLTPLCRAAPDLRSALEAFTTYVPVVISPEGMFELLESRSSFEIRWDCGSGLRQNLQGNLHG